MKRILLIFALAISLFGNAQTQTFTGVKTFTSPPKFQNLIKNNANTKVLTVSPTDVLQWKDEVPENNPLQYITIANGVLVKNKKLTIPNGVSSIEARAFYDSQLTAVVIPNSVTSIGGNAFNSNQLTSVIIPNSVTSIGEQAFYNNPLTSVIISNSVTFIGDGTFGNNQLASVIIPNSVKGIGDYAFINNQLTAVVIPNSVTSIGYDAFYGNQLTAVSLPAGCTYFARTFDTGVVVTGGILIQ